MAEEIKEEKTGKEAVEYVAEAVTEDINLIDSIENKNHNVLKLALLRAIHGAIQEVQTIAFIAKDQSEFYQNNFKYIVILGMYLDILNGQMENFRDVNENAVEIEQNKELFVVMLSKLFSTIKRADIYFGIQKHYEQFKHLLPVQMYIDNVINVKEN